MGDTDGLRDSEALDSRRGLSFLIVVERFHGVSMFLVGQKGVRDCMHAPAL
jgi:hypothetical protein